MPGGNSNTYLLGSRSLNSRAVTDSRNSRRGPPYSFSQAARSVLLASGGPRSNIVDEFIAGLALIFCPDRSSSSYLFHTFIDRYFLVSSETRHRPTFRSRRGPGTPHR